MNLVVLNLFAGPGVGKSTLAAELFAVMKKRGDSVELVTEYAKDMVFENRANILQDQVYILAKQNRRLERLRGRVQYAVTDSPLPTGMAYCPDDYLGGLYADLTFKCFHQFTNVNFLLLRNAQSEFRTEGRVQTGMDEAIKCDDRINAILNNNLIPRTGLVAHAPDNVSTILQCLALRGL